MEPPQKDVHHRFDPATDKLDPFLHILMGLTVKRQIMLNDPPETKKTIEALTSKKGFSEMEQFTRSRASWSSSCTTH